jgi:hypothetical protein
LNPQELSQEKNCLDPSSRKNPDFQKKMMGTAAGKVPNLAVPTPHRSNPAANTNTTNVA